MHHTARTLNLPIALGVGGLHLTIVIPALQETPSAASVLSADTFKMSVVQQLRGSHNYYLYPDVSLLFWNMEYTIEQ